MDNINNGKATNRLTLLRKERGLSQRELSEMIYIDQRMISNLENGIYTLSNLIVLADFYGVSLDYILKRSDNGRKALDLKGIDFKILKLLGKSSNAEKERLLKHLELDNSLKIQNGK